ncbi:DUF4253 domain-containing protein [Dactylosporangium sp. CA-152071]|uniref:DUF4253 domain-containing protein n=1 Tax=Dactylosporangium sp. CA-152071 TaxID=3239933 RepID=UPI003D90793F
MTAVRGFLVPGEDSLEWWWRLRAQHRGTGLWPVLMTPETPEELTPFRIRTPEEEAALRYDGAALLAGWFEGRLARYGGDYADTLRAELRGEGEWRPRPELPGFGVAEYAEEVFVALVPVAAPWQVPLALHCGGWNEYPTPAEHAAILKHFHARYGAELVAMTGTTAEFTVKWPPRDRAGALRLAAEYRVYNDGEYDYYGADTLTDLAVSLSHATVWRAWWD